ncbi:hypothetical protein C8F04DRAFT_1196808 [Mycena alexandri]|uniref:Uncharacterized protein n=1 Tax=Mycena alexandri TaxID=1745969 RepID=A0AAD6WPG8_9AGAR|nr:hypothetical protein C8F04DRAFT_1196808 [Mycena alexandri]
MAVNSMNNLEEERETREKNQQNRDPGCAARLLRCLQSKLVWHERRGRGKEHSLFGHELVSEWSNTDPTAAAMHKQFAAHLGRSSVVSEYTQFLPAPSNLDTKIFTEVASRIMRCACSSHGRMDASVALLVTALREVKLGLNVDHARDALGRGRRVISLNGVTETAILGAMPPGSMGMPFLPSTAESSGNNHIVGTVQVCYCYRWTLAGHSGDAFIMGTWDYQKPWSQDPGNQTDHHQSATLRSDDPHVRSFNEVLTRSSSCGKEVARGFRNSTQASVMVNNNVVHFLKISPRCIGALMRKDGSLLEQGAKDI